MASRAERAAARAAAHPSLVLPPPLSVVVFAVWGADVAGDGDSGKAEYRGTVGTGDGGVAWGAIGGGEDQVRPMSGSLHPSPTASPSHASPTRCVGLSDGHDCFDACWVRRSAFLARVSSARAECSRYVRRAAWPSELEPARPDKHVLRVSQRLSAGTPMEIAPCAISPRTRARTIRKGSRQIPPAMPQRRSPLIVPMMPPLTARYTCCSASAASTTSRGEDEAW